MPEDFVKVEGASSKVAVEEARYWIQDQSRDGVYFDSIGLDPRTTRAQAIKELKDWAKAFPNRRPRLIVRVDIQIMV